jgi:hypothetical protein
MQKMGRRRKRMVTAAGWSEAGLARVPGGNGAPVFNRWVVASVKDVLAGVFPDHPSL